MITYTFVFEYRGGTYIKQVEAIDLEVAIDTWAKMVGSDIPKFPKKMRTQLLIELKEQIPTLLTGLKNVWYYHLMIGKFFGHLNIIATI
jgi:hypothetical protein